MASAWQSLGADQEFALAPGNANYAFNTTVDFGGRRGEVCPASRPAATGAACCASTACAEVRFLYVPVLAREPASGFGATGLEPQVTLSWRAGRQAVSHAVYFLGTAAQAVIDATAPVATVAQPSYPPRRPCNLGDDLLLEGQRGQRGGTPRLWAGPVWSFTTKSMSSSMTSRATTMTTEPHLRDLDRWHDRRQERLDVGRLHASRRLPNGRSSMAASSRCRWRTTTPRPRIYSEAVRTFDTAQDWTGNGVTHLASGSAAIRRRPASRSPRPAAR